MGIKVRAHRQGYYGHFREVDDEFNIADEAAFHDSWMERADGKSKRRAALPPTATTGNNPAGAKLRDSMNDLPDDLG